jgi:MFS transporter, CP family, cyanate transporter
MASGYYGLNAWLPDAYGELGWSDDDAGLLLAAMTLTAIPASFVIPWLSDHRGGRLPWLTGTIVLVRVLRRRVAYAVGG